MSNVKVGDKVEILEVGHFNVNVVKIGDIAEVIDVIEDQILLGNKGWKRSQSTSPYREGEYWKLVTNTIEPPTINSEPFITIKGVEVGSSLERALNLVVAVHNGDGLRTITSVDYISSTYVHQASKALGAMVSMLESEGMGYYVLKSEDEAIKAKNIKESFDKEIQELENKLQELKTKRG